ncbi:ABC transporter permease [Alicyclobacillus vulcanalis]|uniref:Putative ABC transport system permease protein n=2 Tax=Alicyclobacillus TaxID=29330 RepID=A0A1N7KBN2_9BACL|nr:ABC transporter permease [Alicyclobacillus vulcanalis]SIS58949.1 putative ABC transport system permease protein [Alicyclobacillus vulcanalis]
MNIDEMLRIAFSSLAANKARAFLTMLGIWIGVAAILAIVAVGNGGKALVIGAISNGSQSNVIQIVPRELVAPGLPQPGQVLSIDSSDLSIAASFSGVESVSETFYGTAVVQSGDKSDNVTLFAGPADLDQLARFLVVRGRMFTSQDVLSHANVAVISESLANKLFGSGNPLGAVITLSGVPLEVIGVAQPEQASLYSLVMGSDNLYIPDTTCEDIFPNWTASEMDVVVKPGVPVQSLASRILLALNIHAGDPDAFADSSGLLASVAALVTKVTTILTAVIGAVAGIALVVGGVGVMNIMLVSVTERTQEIGIRVSLGARKRDIILQFLVESMVITSLGGVAGIATGFALSAALRAITGIPASVPWTMGAVAFGFSAAIGVICGLYPAVKAANLNPIEALRYE